MSLTKCRKVDTLSLTTTKGKTMAILNYKKIEEALRDREPFTGNSMRSEYVDTDFIQGTGKLSDFDKRWLYTEKEIARTKGLPFYVVYSYATPIAWAYGDTVSIPEVKYSPTTSRQQTRVKINLKP